MSDIASNQPAPTSNSSPLTLRDYQSEGVANLRDAYRRGARAPLFQLATGGGKTVVFSHIVQSAAAKGTRTLVLAHRRELVKQASLNLDWCGVAHGIIAAGQDRDHNAMVLVGSIQTVVRRLETLPQFGLIVADEAHHAVSKTWSALLASQPNARLLGVTATPQRLDGKGLGSHCGGHFDALVCGPATQALVDAGHLAPLKVYLPAAAIDVRGVRKIAGDFAEDELEERAMGVTGDAVAEFQALPAGTTAIVFCVTVKHAQQVAAAFADAGFRAACVHGATPTVERDAMIQGLGTGQVQVLTSCEVISEGLDVPSVGCVILLRPTQSLTMCFQQIGRGMRPKADGSALVVLDHARNCLMHGLPTEPMTWTLDGVDKDLTKTPPKPWECFSCKVLNSPARQDCAACGAPKPWLCPNGECRTLNPGDTETCVACGTERPRRRILQADDGAMAEYRPEAYAHIVRLKYRQLLARPRTEAELAAYARAHGYKPGWVYWRLKDQQEQFGQGRAA
jgi:superfamily II DNA or RNA helicase